MIDVKDIKPGDKLVIEATVLQNDGSNKLCLEVRFGESKSNLDETWISIAGIIEHKPKPIEFKVGDKVKIIREINSYVYKVLAVYKDKLWLEKNEHVSTYLTSDFELAND